jgi:hypothetical protein
MCYGSAKVTYQNIVKTILKWIGIPHVTNKCYAVVFVHDGRA